MSAKYFSAFWFNIQLLLAPLLVLTCMPTVFVASAFEQRMSTPFVFLKVIEAMYPRLDSSAATKYSPETPDKTVFNFSLLDIIFFYSTSYTFSTSSP